MKRVVSRAISLMLVAGAAAASASGDTIVLPALPNASGNLIPFASGTVGTDVSVQHQVFASSSFTGGPIRITQIAFAPDATLANTNQNLGGVSIRLGYTGRVPNAGPPSGLDIPAAGGGGSPNSIGTMSDLYLNVATTKAIGTGGSDNFETAFVTNTPFYYDPSMGNLLVEIVDVSGNQNMAVSRAAGSAQSTRSFSTVRYGSMAGGVGTTATRMQFTYTPTSNLACNGGFESGGFSPCWTQFGNTGATAVGGAFLGISPFSGSFQAYFGPVGSTGGIGQPVGVAAGTPVTVDLKYQATGTGPNSIGINLGATNLFSLTNDTSHTAWTPIVSTAPAPAANPQVSMTFRNDPLYDYVDGIAVYANDIACQGGFENGSFGPCWAQSGNMGFTSVTGSFNGINPHSGSFLAEFGPVGSTGAISQNINVAAGTMVEIDFWYQAQGSGPQSFSADFGGQNLVAFSNDTSHTNWTEFNFKVPAPVDNPVLSFTSQNDPDYNYLDDIRVTLPDLACQGGFENGAFAPCWTQFGDTSFTSVSTGIAHTGMYAGSFGPTSGNGGVQQTINVAAGTPLRIEFWYQASGTPNFFSADLGAHNLTSFTNDTSHPNYTQFVYNTTAPSDNPVLAFTFFNQPSFDDLDDVHVSITAGTCYANCDGSTSVPFLNVNDFICFQSQFASGSPYANCDHSTTPPVLNVNDFICFQTQFAAGCSAP